MVCACRKGPRILRSQTSHDPFQRGTAESRAGPFSDNHHRDTIGEIDSALIDAFRGVDHRPAA
jgi:hypothetical protein